MGNREVSQKQIPFATGEGGLSSALAFLSSLGGGTRREEEDSLLHTPQLFSLTTIDKIRKIWYIFADPQRNPLVTKRLLLIAAACALATVGCGKVRPEKNNVSIQECPNLPSIGTTVTVRPGNGNVSWSGNLTSITSAKLTLSAQFQEKLLPRDGTISWDHPNNPPLSADAFRCEKKL